MKTSMLLPPIPLKQQWRNKTHINHSHKEQERRLSRRNKQKSERSTVDRLVKGLEHKELKPK